MAISTVEERISAAAVGAVHCAQQKTEERRKRKGVETKTRRSFVASETTRLPLSLAQKKKKMVKNLKLSIFHFFPAVARRLRASKGWERERKLTVEKHFNTPFSLAHF